MRRREFVTLGGAAAAWPLAARAQQPAIPVVGYLDGGDAEPNPNALIAFRKGLSDADYVEGRNVLIEFRVTDQVDRLPALAAELVRLRVNVIYAIGSPNSALAAKAATTTIPIVFSNGSDPVKVGLVASMNRPGGNVTGLTNFANELVAKRLELIRELVPQAGKIGFLINPANLNTAGSLAMMQAAARSVGQQISIVTASTEAEIDLSFATVAQQQVGALVVNGDAFYISRRKQIAALAAHNAIPANYNTREFVEAGGLMSYGDDRFETRRQAGLYVGRILKGEKPSDLPVLQPTKFDFVINLKTAKALGIEFPPSFHLRATEVIE